MFLFFVIHERAHASRTYTHVHAHIRAHAHARTGSIAGNILKDRCAIQWVDFWDKASFMG